VSKPKQTPHKALAGALVAAVTTLAAVTPDGITGAEWLGILAAAGAGYLGVYVAPRNRDRGRRRP
jgi:D-arabinose 1-dehydrogenase-like Zn-dependent alcohol dehydrogenase